MSATLQITGVMKTLGVITLKDHSLARVSQGTKAMDTIVQVKFFGFFQVYLKQFSTIRLSLRGDFLTCSEINAKKGMCFNRN